MGIGALFEHENHRGTGLKLIADRFLLLIVRKMLDVTRCRRMCCDRKRYKSVASVFAVALPLALRRGAEEYSRVLPAEATYAIILQSNEFKGLLFSNG